MRCIIPLPSPPPRATIASLNLISFSFLFFLVFLFRYWLVLHFQRPPSILSPNIMQAAAQFDKTSRHRFSSSLGLHLCTGTSSGYPKLPLFTGAAHQKNKKHTCFQMTVIREARGNLCPSCTTTAASLFISKASRVTMTKVWAGAHGRYTAMFSLLFQPGFYSTPPPPSSPPISLSHISPRATNFINKASCLCRCH